MDTLIKGLAIRITKTGKKTFSYRYKIKDKGKRYTIGDFPTVSLAQARSRAEELYVLAKQEIDPQREKMEKRNSQDLTIRELASLFMKHHFPKLRESTSTDYRRRIENTILPALGDINVKELNRIEIIRFLDEVSENAPSQHRKFRALLSSMYSFAIGSALCEFNPVSSIRKGPKTKRRERYYSESEVKELWKAFEEEVEPFSSLFKILLLTGQRRGETMRMKWVDIKENVWVIPADQTKAGRSHHLPLSTMAIKLLDEIKALTGDSDYVFESPRCNNQPLNSSTQNASNRIKKKTSVKDFRLHDLRRTAATHMAKLGVERTVLGKVLNHKGLSGDNSVTAIYDRFDYMDEKRIALQRWSDHLYAILNPNRQKAKIYKLA